MISRFLSSIAAHTGAGLFAELDDIEPCPDQFVQEALPLEDDEIPLHDAVETRHRIAEKMRMYGE